MVVSLGPGKGCGCSGGSVSLDESQLKQQLRKNRVVMAQILPMGGDDPRPIPPLPIPPDLIRPVPRQGCEDCERPVGTVPANQFCMNPPNADCNGRWPWWNDYIYQWYVIVYHCPEGSFYQCHGPFRTTDCCRTDNTQYEPCQPPPTDPFDPSQPLQPCRERVEPTVRTVNPPSFHEVGEIPAS